MQKIGRYSHVAYNDISISVEHICDSGSTRLSGSHTVNILVCVLVSTVCDLGMGEIIFTAFPRIYPLLKWHEWTLDIIGHWGLHSKMPFYIN